MVVKIKFKVILILSQMVITIKYKEVKILYKEVETNLNQTILMLVVIWMKH